jgi:hypothetical protein
MTQKQLEKYLEKLWEKHGHPDRHGYKDFMYQDEFNAAVREALQDCGVDVAKVRRTDSRGDHD